MTKKVTSRKRSLKSKKTNKVYIFASNRNGYGKSYYLSNKPPTSDITGNLTLAANKGKTWGRSICRDVFVLLGLPMANLRSNEVLELHTNVDSHSTYKCKVDVTKKNVK